MKYLAIFLALAAFGAAGTAPALSRTVNHPTKHFARVFTSPRPLYLYSGGWACQSPALLCTGEASQR